MQKIILEISGKNFNPDIYPDVDCFAVNSSLDSAFLQNITTLLHSKNKLVLAIINDDISFYKQYQFDGIIADFSSSENIKNNFNELKKSLNKDAVIGIISRARRHESMVTAECEPDFIIFKIWENISEKQKELLSWYQEFFLIQSAAYMVDKNPCLEEINTDILMINEEKYNILVAKNKILR